MTNKEFYDLTEELFEDCLRISRAKGADYTKGSEDALANFKLAGKDIGVGALSVCWIFMNKHYQAITNYVRTKGQSESEPIAERLKDLINYATLMHGIIVEEERRKEMNY